MRWEQDSCIHTHIYTHIQMAGCSDDEGFDGRIVRMAVYRALSQRTQRQPVEVAHHSSTNRPNISRDTIAIPNSDFIIHTSPDGEPTATDKEIHTDGVHGHRCTNTTAPLNRDQESVRIHQLINYQR